MKSLSINLITILCGAVIGASTSAKNCNIEETFPSVEPHVISVVDAGVTSHVSTR